MTTETTTTTRRPLFPATTAVWRFITRPIRWLWRRKLKITLWLATLITLGWQYENWHGRREYKEQLALFRAEYGDMKWSDFAPPRIPDEENFFAAPVFESFVVKEKPVYARPAGETEESLKYREKRRELEDAMPHARFLRIRLPEIKTVPSGQVAEFSPVEGITFLDLKTWAQEEAKAGRKLPEGMTELQWLHASLPEDETIKGFIAALSRKKAGALPHTADRWAIGEKLNNRAAIPIPAVSGVFGMSQRIALRARVAARMDAGTVARQHCEVIWALTDGFGSASSMVGTLVALALTDVANTATAEALASRCCAEADLVILRDRMVRIDEERYTFTGLMLEGFGFHLWPGDIREWHREQLNRPATLRWDPMAVYMWACAKGPDGWIDANWGTHLRWWRSIMVPQTAGDDLLALRDRMNGGLPEVNKEMASGPPGMVLPSPRRIWAVIAFPAFSNIVTSGINAQTRRRQLLLAIAIERHLLAKGTLPQQPADLVPAFIDAIPGDPWQPGTPLRWEVPDKDREPGAPAIRYRILSAGKDTTLGFPEQIP